MVGANGAAKPPRKEDRVACQGRHSLPGCAGLLYKSNPKLQDFLHKSVNIMSQDRLAASHDGLGSNARMNSQRLLGIANLIFA
jgi:hypothetical protein